jgi:hypothetical protein
MTDYSQLMDDYNVMMTASEQLFRGWKPAPLNSVRVSRSQRLLDRNALSEALASCSGAHGWLLFSDRKVVLNGRQVPALEERLLSGELYHDAESIRIASAGIEQWLWVKTAVKEAEVSEASHLATRLTHQAADPSLGKLHYRQLWLRDELGRLRVEDAVFEGFQGA